ncbi:MAG: hypothetical protein WCO12_01680 [bacterium]
MKIIENKKYRVLIECHHFTSQNELEEKGFVLFSGEEYVVKFVYEKNGSVFVNLGDFTNQYGNTVSRTINLETFNSCFEEGEVTNI